MVQKSSSAAVRMVTLPIVSSAWSILSSLYTDTKSSHPSLKVVCEALENRAVILSTMASNTVSPAMMKLEPQISIANDIACKSLDWLESAFPLLQTPTEEVVAIAMDKMHAATSTLHNIQHTVGNAMDRVVHRDYHSAPVMVRAVTVAEAGLDQALSISEALVDHMLPPAEDEKEEEANSVQRLESTTLWTYPVRLLSISTKLCRRTYKVIVKLPSSPPLAQRLETHFPKFLSSLPVYLQHQAGTVILFVSQMYTLGRPAGSHSSVTPPPPAQDLPRAQCLQVESPTWRLKMDKDLDCECPTCELYTEDGCDAERCISP